MKVLIVDDSAVMRKVVERALRQAGLQLSDVLEAANGAEALTVLRAAAEAESQLSLIVSDIHMPVMDGLEFLRVRREENLLPEVPAVVITTEGAEQQVLRAIAAGARGYICKPFTAEHMQVRVVPLVRAAQSAAAPPAERARRTEDAHAPTA